jgi:hypothetical protein
MIESSRCLHIFFIIFSISMLNLSTPTNGTTSPARGSRTSRGRRSPTPSPQNAITKSQLLQFLHQCSEKYKLKRAQTPSLQSLVTDTSTKMEIENLCATISLGNRLEALEKQKVEEYQPSNTLQNTIKHDITDIFDFAIPENPANPGNRKFTFSSLDKYVASLLIDNAEYKQNKARIDSYLKKYCTERRVYIVNIVRF